MSGELKLTPLYDWHRANGARMVDFAGWSMPVQYGSIVEEHTATRTAAGVFDISHMGRLRFDGPGAAGFLDRLLTRRVLGIEPGQIRYSLVTNESGGILDDVLVYHLQDPPESSYYLLVVNAGNRQKIVSWIEPHLADAQNVGFTDQTLSTAMIAVQGPGALKAAQSLLADRLDDLRYYQGSVTRIGNGPGVVSRTGYTGEDGCELIVPGESAVAVWQQVLAAGGSPAGLGARDTLRLEAAMPLYGHELSEQIDPYTAGLGFAVQNKDRQYIGRAALLAKKELLANKEQTDRPKRIGLSLSGRRVPRQGYNVYRADELVGQVTSGTFSPTLERPIAMAYVRAAAANEELNIDIRGRHEPARVVELPFYRRPQPEPQS